MEILSVDYSRTVCLKYVDNFRRIRLNGRKDYIGKLKMLLQFSSSIASYDQNLTMQNQNQFLSLIPQRNLFQLNSAGESGPSSCPKLLALLSTHLTLILAFRSISGHGNGHGTATDMDNFNGPFTTTKTSTQVGIINSKFNQLIVKKLIQILKR